MKRTCNSHKYLGFLLGTTILLFHLQVRADTTQYLLTTTESPSVAAATTENPTTSISAETGIYTTQIATFESTPTTQPTTFGTTFLFPTSAAPTPSETPTTAQPSSTAPPEAPTSSYALTSPDEELETLGEGQSSAELCKETHKKEMLICLIIIGVLLFICVSLLVVTVAMANKLSYLKKRRSSKRLPRSNGDFLSANSLWPAGLETLQRLADETAETDLTKQSSGLERTNTGQGKMGEEASKKLASEISDRQKQKDILAKPPNTTITSIEI